MNLPSIDRQALDRELGALLAKRRQEQLDAIKPDTLAFLTLVPVWTQKLADTCDFPLYEYEGWEEFWGQAEAAGLLERTVSPAAEGTLFWMSDAARPRVLEDLRRMFSKDPDYPVHMVSTIGHRIYDSSSQGVFVPPATLRWAPLQARPRRQTRQAALPRTQPLQARSRPPEHARPL